MWKKFAVLFSYGKRVLAMSAGFDYSAAKKNLHARIDRQKNSRLELHAHAEKEVRAIIEMIIRDFNPKRIIQWGSILIPEKFDENSDIDIAVEGLKSPKDFFDLRNQALNMTDIPLDLVEIEKVDDLAQDSILQYGKVVYERK